MTTTRKSTTAATLLTGAILAGGLAGFSTTPASAASVESVASTTSASSSSQESCAWGRYMPNSKTGVYISNAGGRLSGLIKYKYPGEIVIGRPNPKYPQYLLVRMGSGEYGVGRMRADKLRYLGNECL